MDVSCPQCGGQLQVDAENSVVYCPSCGFAVKVDPQTGEATPISMGNAQGGAAAPAAMAPSGGGGGFASQGIFGLDRTTFLLAGVILSLVAVLALNLDIIFAVGLILLVLYFYYTSK